MGRVLIGGVGYRWQRDASFGVVASDRLAALEWPSEVDVMDLGYGAIYVTEDLLQAQPPYSRLIVLGALERGRVPGRLYRYRWDRQLPPAEEIQARIYEAGAGVIDLEHLLIVAQYFRALPPEVLVIELEPVDTAGGEALSAAATERLEELVAELRRSERRAPQVTS
jgi:hydrogenase maturation protease